MSDLWNGIMTQALNQFTMTETSLKIRLSKKLITICRHCDNPIRIGDNAVSKKSYGKSKYKIYHEFCARSLNII